MKTHIFLVEDDVELAEWIAEYLTQKLYQVTVFHNGQAALEAILTQAPDLIILDGMLPGLDGLEVCRAVRSQQETPIIMLTARDEEMDEILGLEMGADDYLTKPVRGRILETRIKALLRRISHKADTQDGDDDAISIGGLVVNQADRQVYLDSEEISVSSKEFDALWLLVTHVGQVVTRDDMTKTLRGFEFDGFDRSTDLCVSRLRKKLGDSGGKPYKIKTIWGRGYQLARDVW